MANTGFLSTEDLDFDSLKANLKTYLSGQTRFQDYDFDGSNMAVLLDLLAYNTHLNAHYLNMVASEMFLDTAQLRETVVSHAKELNYVPRSRVSASATVTVSITAGDSPDIITIPKGYAFQSSGDGTTLSFITNEAIVIKADGDGNYQATFDIYEGKPVEETFVAQTLEGSNGSTIYMTQFKLSSTNVDISSIEVEVLSSLTDATSTKYTRAESLFGLTNQSQAFFVQVCHDAQYEVVFGNGIIGKALQNGNVVIIRYRDTVGDEGNGYGFFKKTSNIDGYSAISVVTDTIAAGGAERESIEEVRYNAPRYFQTQERAVIAEDFRTMIKQRFPQLQAVSVYGGELANPKQYGKVIISVKPFGTTGVISNSLKEQIADYIRGKNMTTEPVVVDPEYYYVNVVSEVQYDPNLTTKSVNTLKTEIVTRLLALNNSAFSDFGRDLRYSKVLKTIDEDDSIISNDTEIKIIKRWAPLTDVEQKLVFSFDNEIHSHAGYAHTGAITSSVFTYAIGEDEYQAYISDDGFGTLYIYSFAADGTVITLNSNIGTVNYTTGEITLSTSVRGYTSYISLYALLKKKDIIVTKNKFLLMDASDFDISIIEKID